MMLFLLILAIVALAIFTGLKLAFLIFLGIIAAAIIAIAFLVGGFTQLGKEADVGNGPLDRVLFGEDK